MKFLFFFIHPAYFHVFRNTINTLKEKGHDVEIIITSKDVLEDLVKNEGWEYINIFPRGRKIKWLPTYLSAGINMILTIWKLEMIIKWKKHDLFVTDDLIGFNGLIHRIPTILFQDDDVTAVPETIIAHIFTKHIFSQFCSNMGYFSYKKIPFDGYKELAYLHPNKFTPKYEVVKQFNSSGERYFILRLVSLRAIHDTNKTGLTNDDVWQIIKKLELYGRVFINSERKLPSEFAPYRIKIRVNDIAHALYYADLVISDSQTMSAEAGVLGTPFIRFNDFVGRISYLKELEQKYGLGIGIKTDEKKLLYKSIEKFLKMPNIKASWNAKKEKMLNEKIDMTDYMVWLFENYPRSIQIIQKKPEYQYRFK